MSETCLFCRIIAGAVPAHIVHRGRHTLAFLDIRPLFVGHTLLVPVDHHVTLAELPPTLVPPLFETAQRISAVMETTLGAAGSFVAMNNRVSQSVPHLHVHVVPRNRKDGLRGFFWPRTTYDGDQHMADTAAKLRSAIDG